MNPSPSTLPENGKVVVLGGGPGGTACALALHRLATEMGRQVQIILVEGKQFIGERQYNQCVGVLSPPLPELLEERLGIPFPHHLCQIELEGYMFHGPKEQILLQSDEESSYALRRVQFDEYMLNSVIQRGIPVLQARAVDLEFHGDCVVVYTENTSIETCVVVGAFGLDEGSASFFSRTTPYRPPEALDSIVTNFVPTSGEDINTGTHIHAFLPPDPLIEFGAITPKRSHLTINIAGVSVDTRLMHAFLNRSEVGSVLRNFEPILTTDCLKLQLFKGRFPRSLARNYYGDRYVMVGDSAGLVRAFKGKGTTSAVLTGIRAAETILRHGISKQAFHQNYRVANQDIIKDLPYGHLMRLVAICISRIGLLDSVIRAARSSPTLRAALYDAVSAHSYYKSVLRGALHPQSIWPVLRAMLRFSP